MLSRLDAAQATVEAALKLVSKANEQYINACRELAEAKIAAARDKPHPWLGMTVYRVMKGERTRSRAEYGIVCFKELGDPDYGNPHIQPGTYYILVDNKSAHWLDDNWQLDLL